ncbi:cupin domain-containing protein [Kitasatospora sp. NPDC004669]|uniref:JmjC domain-containing protein n=1 Tax=Kitasatospora sp. NPDC004669 TaxID=3154555 RepID=UPI0033B2C42E
MNRGPTAVPSGVLARLTGSPEEFLLRAPAEPVIYRARGDMHDLLSFEAIDRLLAERALRRPALRLIHQGRQLEDHEYLRRSTLHSDTADPRRIGEWLADGATLVLQVLEDAWQPVGEFAAELGNELGHPVHVNAYLTPGDSQGFSLHHDIHDAFIVQVDGTKDWVVHRPLVANPLPHETWDAVLARNGRGELVAPDSPPHQTFTLSPGDCLWLPRGWVHAARSTESTSLHLTVSVDTTTAAWAWQEIAEIVGRQEPMRTALSRALITDPDRATEEISAVLAAATSWLSEASPEKLVDVLRTAALRRFPAPLPDAVTGHVATSRDEYLHETFAVRGHHVFALETIEDTLHVRMAGRTLTMPAALREGMADLLARNTVRSAELSWLDGPDSRVALLRRLRREGIIAHVDPR